MRTIVLVLLLSSAVFARQGANPPKRLWEELKGYADTIAAGKALPAEDVKAYRKRYDELNELMHAHKPTARKGLGIETALIGARKNPKAALAKRDALLAAAYANLAIGELTFAYADQPKTPVQQQRFIDLNHEMIAATKEVIRAAKANDEAALVRAATRVNKACNDCHR